MLGRWRWPIIPELEDLKGRDSDKAGSDQGRHLMLRFHMYMYIQTHTPSHANTDRHILRTYLRAYLLCARPPPRSKIRWSTPMPTNTIVIITIIRKLLARPLVFLSIALTLL